MQTNHHIYNKLQIRHILTSKKVLLKMNEIDIQNFSTKFSDIKHCPVRNILSHISSKWTILVILITNSAEIIRFNPLLHNLNRWAADNYNVITQHRLKMQQKQN